MSSIPPSREWMLLNDRCSKEYMDGIISFLNFTKANGGGVDWFSCTCVRCCNGRGKMTLKEISEHLICNGIDRTYKIWYCHGEKLSSSSTANVSNVNVRLPSGPQRVECPTVMDLFNDAFQRVGAEGLDACMNDLAGGDCAPEELNEHLNDNEYEELRNDVFQPIYPSCRPEDTKLSVTIELMSLKARNQWSDKSFSDLLKTLKKLLPSGNTLPGNRYYAKKMITSLGMNYEMIHACPNDCILYWGEHKTRNQCPKCGASRWKSEYLAKTKSKEVPVKVLRYFPLTPRLKRLYSVPWIAEKMTWHSRSVDQDIYMRHPVDSTAWKRVNSKWPDFDGEPRNVRLGLATDGFNPYGNFSLSYSCWPVMIVPYNLPPSLCMKKEFTMLSVLIPRKCGPGKNIDVYLQPLVELQKLWSLGSRTYDSHSKTSFNMRVILLWAIHDFSALGHLSGCKTGGKYCCPVCSEGTSSLWLPHSRKMAYIRTRRFLPDAHVFRGQKSQFNGHEERAKAPRRLTDTQVLQKIEHLSRSSGKVDSRKQRRGKEIEDESTAWPRKSILFDLPYWKDMPVRHNLDVMHVEKNVTENLIHTIMGTKDKGKDGLKARRDLQFLKIRRKMWPIERNNRLFLPKAPFELSREERELWCKTLYSLKMPIGYGPNWKKLVNMDDLQLRGLKSHDYHILMQQLLPILLRHSYKERKPLRLTIHQMSLLFNVICSKVVSREELGQMRDRAAEALCVFEKYFPPSFFIVMMHLIVHLVEEVQLCGPVRYRWMYPFERLMRTFKGYVGNKNPPEGCIAERYIIDESIMYCMEYMPGGRKHMLDIVQYEQVRRWVLQSSDISTEWNERYDEYVRAQTSRGQRRRVERPLSFNAWLSQQLQNEGYTELRRLANGPDFEATSYKRYQVNDYLFCTVESEASKTTQNSGVSMKALTTFRSSTRDRNPVEEEVTYYGVIRNIIELNYHEFKHTVFYCDWVQIEDRQHGCVYDPELNLTHVNFNKLKRVTKEEDEPFILASQASQVFYCPDSTKEGWHTVLEAPKGLTKYVDAYEDPLVFEARMNGQLSTSSLVEDDDYESTDVVEGEWVDDTA